MELPVYYTPEQIEQIREFIVSTYGSEEDCLIGHERESEYVHTDIATVTDEDGERYFVTFGMGARKANAPIPALCNTELVMCATENLDIPSGEAAVIMSQLQNLSKIPFRNNTFFGPGHTVPASEQFKETFGFDAFVLVPNHIVQLPDLGSVFFLLVIPIYQKEREAMMRGNSLEVLSRLEERFGQQVYYADSGREQAAI